MTQKEIDQLLSTIVTMEKELAAKDRQIEELRAAVAALMAPDTRVIEIAV